MGRRERGECGGSVNSAVRSEWDLKVAPQEFMQSSGPSSG